MKPRKKSSRITKVEQARIDAVNAAREVAIDNFEWKHALPVPADIPVPTRGADEKTFGYTAYGNLSSFGDLMGVESAASNSSSHYTGEYYVNVKNKTVANNYCGSHRGIPLWSKKSDALKHALYHLQRSIIEKLVECNKLIADAEKEEQNN